ncbi:phage holin family protein [Erwinia amylovora]
MNDFRWQEIVSVAEGINVPTIAVIFSALIAFLRMACYRCPLRMLIFEVLSCSLITCSFSLVNYFRIPPDTQILVGSFIGLTGTRRLRSLFISFLGCRFRK